MRKSDKDIDAICGTDKEREEYVNKCVDYLLDTLDSVQWRSLAHIRNELAPISLQDKRELLKSLIINPRKNVAIPEACISEFHKTLSKSSTKK